MTKERLIRANPKRDDCPRLRKMSMNAIDHAGPGLVEAVVKNNDAPLGQRTFADGKIMRGNVGRMSAIDADHAQRASAKLEQVS